MRVMFRGCAGHNLRGKDVVADRGEWMLFKKRHVLICRGMKDDLGTVPGEKFPEGACVSRVAEVKRRLAR